MAWPIEASLIANVRVPRRQAGQTAQGGGLWPGVSGVAAQGHARFPPQKEGISCDRNNRNSHRAAAWTSQPA